MRKLAEGLFTGDPEELLPHLEREIANHRESIHKGIDLTFELLVRLMKLETMEIPNSGGVEGIDLSSTFEWLESETGVELDSQDRRRISESIQMTFMEIGGMSVCAVYEIAHTIEHVVFRTRH